MKDELYCSHCGALIDDDDYTLMGEKIICSDCIENYTITCERCGGIIWDSESYGDEYTNLCQSCYNDYYTHCVECDCLLHCDNAYSYDDEYYCSECYHDVRENRLYIHDYNYKPSPIFFGDGERFFGIELEIDGAGNYDDYAQRILDIANYHDECVYIKSDGSLSDGMEIVSYPMTLNYHLDYCWEDILVKAIELGYKSHQTTTCGLHIHVNRNNFGKTETEQEDVISRILYFVEHHWNEVLKFSRRTEYSMNRWAARYGYEKSPKQILDKAKNGNCGRYSAVNLCNYSTIEFRMFRGTLKFNTFLATLQFVNEICNVAISMSDCDLQKLSWSDFVSNIKDFELIQYLKQRNLYINDQVEESEEM